MSGTFLIMIPRRLTLPVLVVTTAVVASGAALLPTDATPPVSGLADVQAVASPARDVDSYLYSVDVDRRTVAYTYDLSDADDGGWYPVAGARSFTPDLGLSPLTLGSDVAPPFADSYGTAVTDRWAVAVQAPEEKADGPDSEALQLRISGGGTTRTVTLEVDGWWGPWDLDVAVWDDTALVAGQLVNLVTGDVVPVQVTGEEVLEPAPGEAPWCRDGENAALADGVLAVYESCSGAVVTYPISAGGVQADDLDVAAGDVVATGEEIDDPLALSRGLLVWSDGEVGVAYTRLGSAPVHRVELPDEVVRVVAQGARFVVVTRPWAEGPVSDLDAWVFEEASAADGAVAHVDLLDGEEWSPEPTSSPTPTLGAVPAPEGEALALSVTEPSSDVDVQTLPVDLYGRTLVWLATDGTITAGTLPALPAGAATATTSGTPKAGQKLTVTGAGYLPGEEIAVWLQSTPVLLATGVAAADGSVRLDVTIPAATAAGAHTVTVVGVESGWRAASAVTVAAAGNPGLRIDTGR